MFEAEPVVFKAAARVNIVGEHTDYNGGLVLPTTTALHTWSAVSERDDRFLRVHSNNANETVGISLDHISTSPEGNWFDYVRGVVLELSAEGVPIQGADIFIDGNIPIGSGLSSSASLELVVAHALLFVAKKKFKPLKLAEICRKAESDTVGVRCGIMDQYALAAAKRNSAMLLDCRTLDVSYVQIPAAAKFILVDSGVHHQLPDGDYNDRRSECELALRILQKKRPQLRSLSDLDHSQLSSFGATLEESLYRRCMHVVSENRRVAQAATALQRRDLPALGDILTASHVSLRDDYDVSCAHSDRLVDSLNSLDGVLGARQIGAGFGGCVLALAQWDKTEQVVDNVLEQWAKVLGARPWIHIVEPSAAAGLVR